MGGKTRSGGGMKAGERRRQRVERWGAAEAEEIERERNPKKEKEKEQAPYVISLPSFTALPASPSKALPNIDGFGTVPLSCLLSTPTPIMTLSPSLSPDCAANTISHFLSLTLPHRPPPPNPTALQDVKSNKLLKENIVLRSNVCSKRSGVAEKIIEKRSCKMIIEKRIMNKEEMPTSLAKTE
uniref:Uncharacterized protein n=1 Tax=Fagus sylvatica TaxID=28930 RepID=A0A2N9FGR2_FAGSY